jgi:hypothetical protein
MTPDASEPRPAPVPPALRLGVLVLALVATVQAAATFGTLRAPEVYRKDLLQDYLAARAVLDGKDPYRPMSVLTAEYVGPVPGALAFPHPTPHPPPALLLTLPLGLTSYPRAAAAWLLLEYGLLAACCVALARGVWRSRGLAAPLALAALALWTCPVRDDLILGQFSVVILALFVASYLAVSAGRQAVGGLWLGAAVALKFLGWPVVAYYAWKRRWRVVLAAAAVLGASHAIAAGVMPGAVARYYAAVAPHAGADYSASDLNISAWTLGQRLFGGLYSQATVNNVTAPPFLNRPALAGPAGSALALAAFAACLVAASRRREESDGFLVMLCASTVLNPIAWDIYLTLLLLPLAVAGARLAARSWPPRPTLALAGLVVFLVVLKLPRELALGGGPERPVSAVRALAGTAPLLGPWLAVWVLCAAARKTADSEGAQVGLAGPAGASPRAPTLPERRTGAAIVDYNH